MKTTEEKIAAIEAAREAAEKEKRAAELRALMLASYGAPT